jgi:hypothetical protein
VTPCDPCAIGRFPQAMLISCLLSSSPPASPRPSSRSPHLHHRRRFYSRMYFHALPQHVQRHRERRNASPRLKSPTHPSSQLTCTRRVAPLLVRWSCSSEAFFSTPSRFPSRARSLYRAHPVSYSAHWQTHRPRQCKDLRHHREERTYLLLDRAAPAHYTPPASTRQTHLRPQGRFKLHAPAPRRLRRLSFSKPYAPSSVRPPFLTTTSSSS